MVVIKDMDMPKCCHWDCPLCNEAGGECMLDAYDKKSDTTKARAKECPLVEIGTCKDCANYVMGALDEEICLIGHELIHKDFFCADFEKRGNEE